MPAKKCMMGEKNGWKWGDSGQCYTYKDGDEKSEGKAKQKAYLQGITMGEKVEDEEKLEMISFMFAEKFMGIN